MGFDERLATTAKQTSVELSKGEERWHILGIAGTGRITPWAGGLEMVPVRFCHLTLLDPGWRFGPVFRPVAASRSWGQVSWREGDSG